MFLHRADHFLTDLEQAEYDCDGCSEGCKHVVHRRTLSAETDGTAPAASYVSRSPRTYSLRVRQQVPIRAVDLVDGRAHDAG